MRTVNLQILAIAILLAVETAVPQCHAQVIVVDFDSLPSQATGAIVDDYLAPFGIRVSGPGKLLIRDDRTMVFPPPSTPIVTASSAHNFLSADSDANLNANFALHFDPPLSELSFTRIAQASNNAGTAYPGWLATAFQGDTPLGTVGPGAGTYSIFPGMMLPAESFSFSGDGITRLQVDSYQNNFAAFASVFLDDLEITPIPEPSSTVLALIAASLLFPMWRRVGPSLCKIN